MRLRFACLFPLLMACGGSTGGRVADGERVPATPFPDEQVDASRGPTGYVTLLSVEGMVVALPDFYEDAARTRTSNGAECSLSRAATERPRKVSAGALTFTVPTRNGEQDFEVLFDPKAGEYEPATFDAFVEPGGILRVSAKGAEAPAFEAEIKTAANIAFDVPEIVELDATAPEDFVVRWNAEGDNDEVFVDLKTGDQAVTCWFDTKASAGTIPAALVSELTKDAAACERSTCAMILASKHSRSVEVGEWTMLVAHGFATIRQVNVTR